MKIPEYEDATVCIEISSSEKNEEYDSPFRIQGMAKFSATGRTCWFFIDDTDMETLRLNSDGKTWRIFETPLKKCRIKRLKDEEYKGIRGCHL